MKIEIELDEERKLRSVVVDGAKLVDSEKLNGYKANITLNLSTSPGFYEECKITTFV